MAVFGEVAQNQNISYGKFIRVRYFLYLWGDFGKAYAYIVDRI